MPVADEKAVEQVADKHLQASVKPVEASGFFGNRRMICCFSRVTGG
jgi:hypothetical protein